MSHFIEKDSKSPHVCFRTINIVYHCFRSHVDWTTNVYVCESLLRMFQSLSKSEVRQLCHAVVQENVGDFEVTMDNIHARDVL